MTRQIVMQARQMAMLGVFLVLLLAACGGTAHADRHDRRCGICPSLRPQPPSA